MSIFTDHPHSIGESYFEHFVSASRFGARLIGAGLACIVHGVFPFWCKTTGSKAIRQLSADMIHGREKFGPGDRRQGEQRDWCI
ncbi:DUF6356 family protein [Erythrobacter aureus]|uniref:DUF6356 family protein n=1 Tax=Erythrobacter aureus TaxID=2182384 RepID=UPI002691911A|tara:strand:+ start:125 stop:376 length:252 start_codon:yes stop_codon:yes gene_type:complete